MTRVGALRASDADREQTVSRLHKAATEGRIAPEELEQRVSTALKARTYGELDATVADLPRDPVHRSRQPSRRRGAGGWALATVRANPLLLVFALPVLAVTAAMMVAMLVVWAVTMVVILVLGGRPRGPRGPRGPWMYTRQRRGYAPPRRHPRSYWA